MKIKCYGPRGSLPAPATKEFDTREFGGNTSCYYVEAGPFRIILDCGSGIRMLGNDLLKAGQGVGGSWIVLLSHYHWDHIQGLPFCIPMFIGANTFHFHGFKPAGHKKSLRPIVEEMLDHQQSNPHFPVAHIDMPSQAVYVDHARQFSEEFWYVILHDGTYKKFDKDPRTFSYPEYNEFTAARGPAGAFRDEDVLHVRTIPLNHPDGCLGYRIDYMGKSMVYATDNEPLLNPNAQLMAHGSDVQWMLLDGQYLDQQLSRSTQTYGHGTPRACVIQAVACRAEHVIIHHHDPGHDDAQLALMEASAIESLAAFEETGLHVEFAREGKEWEI